MFKYGQEVTVKGFGPVVFVVADVEGLEVEVFSAASRSYKWVPATDVTAVSG